MCKVQCNNPYWCASSQPGNSIMFDMFYCAGAPKCYGCSSPYTNCGDACVDTATNPDNCGSCGHSCGAGYSCVASDCVMNSVAIVDTLTPDLVVANSQFTIQYALTPTASNIILSNDWWPHYTFTSNYPRTLSFVPRHDDVGDHRVTVKAYKNILGGTLLGSVTTRVLVTCNPAEPGYGLCCVGDRCVLVVAV